jgi:hypothetical protein
MSSSIWDERPWLCVDLDGCLLRTDTFLEGILAIFRQQPAAILKMSVWLFRGRAQFKQWVAAQVDLDPTTLPYDQGVLRYLRDQHATGRHIVLVTAADQRVATGIAQHLALFDSVFASNAATNLKGRNKRDLLVAQFGRGGFDYIGNSLTDIPIFEQAAKAIYGGQSFMLRIRLALTPKVRVSAIDEERSLSLDAGLLPLFRAFRPELWVAGLLVFLPLAYSWQAFDMGQLKDASLAASSCALVTSSARVSGDLFNLKTDRKDSNKRDGPLASGSISLIAAIHSIWILAVIGGSIALWVNPKVFAAIAIYYFIAKLYSIYLRGWRLISLIVLASLCMLLVLAGEAALRVRVPLWLMLIPSLSFAALAIIRRRSHSLRTDSRTRAS